MRALQFVVLFTVINMAHAAPDDRWFPCFPSRNGDHTSPRVLHGEDHLTQDHADDLFWALDRSRMDVGGHFSLVEVGCGAECIHLASVDLVSGDVRWMPETISNWPIKVLQPVRYRDSSRLIVVLGRLDEHGHGGPLYFLIDDLGFHPVSEGWLQAQPCDPAAP